MFQNNAADISRYCLHKKWRHTVADLFYPLFKFAGKNKFIGKTGANNPR